METWMSGAMLIEVTMLSFLLSLWMAWMSLRGLFRMLPARNLPIRAMTQRGTGAVAMQLRK
jgi:hypothetical protein